MFEKRQQYDLTGWLFIQLNSLTQRFVKDNIALISQSHATKDGITIVVDVYKDNQFLTSRDNLNDALQFVDTL